MAIQLSDLIKELKAIEETRGGDLMVVTDMDQAIEGAEFNEDGGSPACVLVVE